MKPSWLFTMPTTVERPRPVPFPTSLVVKNGSKIFSRRRRGCRCQYRRRGGRRSGPGRRARAGDAAGGVTLTILHRDAQGAAVGHGVPRIHAEIHQDLVELGRRRLRRARGLSATFGLDPDIARERIANQLVDLLDEIAAGARCALAFRPAGKSEHLPDDSRRAIRAFLDRGEKLLTRGLRPLAAAATPRRA